MITDIDIYRVANEFIKQHGEDAPLHAAMRADELVETGDMDGRTDWLRIVMAIEELLAKERPEGTLLEQAVGIYDEVLARKVPITRGGEFEHVQGGTVLYRSIILPLSEGQGTIDFLLGAANSKTKDEEA